MANASILAAFERMWQHVVIGLNSKADADHTHEGLDKNIQVQQVSQTFTTTEANQSEYILTGITYNPGDSVTVHVSGFKIPSSEVSVSDAGVVTLSKAPEEIGTEVEVTLFQTVMTNNSIATLNLDNKMSWYRQATAPEDINSMWVDTSVTPNIIRFYNGVEWEGMNSYQ